MGPSVVVGVLLRDSQGRVLLDKRETPPGVGTWAVPGGHVELDESLQAAAVREVFEETSLVIQDSSLRPLGTFEVLEDGLHLVLVMFAADILTGTPEAGQWFAASDLDGLPMSPTGRSVLQQCLPHVGASTFESAHSQMVPAHVGLIPDGTRRWSRVSGMPLVEGYRLAMDRIAEFVKVMMTCGVESVTLYLLSRQNLTRSPEDLAAVDEAESYLISDLLIPLSKNLDFDIVVCGSHEGFPPRVAWAVDALPCVSRKPRSVYLLIAYDPFEELALTGASDVSSLWVDRPIDLVIRTSGERRISNFVPLQSGYAEFVFLDEHLNDMRQQDWLEVLAEYGQRERRFGS